MTGSKKVACEILIFDILDFHGDGDSYCGHMVCGHQLFLGT
jgi:hypothetical protein